MGVSKNRGTPKMDGENNGKPYEQMDDLGVPLFLATPIWSLVVSDLWSCHTRCEDQSAPSWATISFGDVLQKVGSYDQLAVVFFGTSEMWLLLFFLTPEV